VLGVQYLLGGGASQVFNLSNGNGFSVREVIETAQAVTGRPITVIEQARRPGDPPVLVGSGEKAWQVLGWQPQYAELADIVNHAWNWHQQRHEATAPNSVEAEPQTPASAKAPLVSVIVPAYNAERFLPQTLASIQAQTYQNLEILVVDDGSCDRTPQIVQELAQQDPRIQLLQQDNGGVAAARNRGIRQAKGEFIAPIDADDLWLPETVAKLVNQLQKRSPQVGVVYAWSADIDEQAHPSGGIHAATVVGHVHRTLICHNFLGNASSTLIRKTCLDCVGGYDPQLKAQNAQGCEDWDLYLRLAERFKFAVVPEFLVGYRKVASSMSGDLRQMARSQALMLKAVQSQNPEIPGFLYRLSRSSFYLYLAYQCELAGNAHRSLAWLKEAAIVDPITPLLRLGFYTLMVKNLAKLTFASLQQFTQAIAAPTRMQPIPVTQSSRRFLGDTVTVAALNSTWLMRHKQPRPSIVTPPVAPRRKSTHSLAVEPRLCLSLPLQRPTNPFKIRLKVLVSGVLHRVLSNV
ncbi:MAG: glycosyltransferase, partial [Cyanobacteria bacterium P01_H01_bin.58]